jgi:hypothetical protein
VHGSYVGHVWSFDAEKVREEFQTASQKKRGGTGVKDFMDSMVLGVLVEQVHDHVYVYFVSSHLRISVKRFVPVQFNIWENLEGIC